MLHPVDLRRLGRRASSRSTRCRSGPTWPATAARFVAGDPALVGELLAVRKNLGLMMPGPQQVAMAAALADTAHAEEQHARYAARRAALRAALESAGFRIDHSEASLYLWATPWDEDCWETVAWLAERGILVAPGDFYGAAGGAARAGGVHRHRRAGRRRGRTAGLSRRQAESSAATSWSCPSGVR